MPPTEKATPRQVLLTSQPTLAGEVPNGLAGRFQSAPIPLPEYLRLPRPGERCPLTQVCGSTLREWNKTGRFILNVRRPGQLRGVALISVVRLKEFLEANGSEVISAVGGRPRKRLAAEGNDNIATGEGQV